MAPRTGDLVIVKAGKAGEEVTGIVTKVILNTHNLRCYEVMTSDGQIVALPSQIAILLMKEL